MSMTIDPGAWCPNCQTWKAQPANTGCHRCGHLLSKTKRTRYCGPCEAWKSAKETVCKDCGAETENTL